MAGYRCRCECLRIKEVRSARAMPNAIEEENEIKKMPTPFRRESAGFPSPLNRDSVLKTAQLPERA
jgi:hypothetical protein